MPNKRETNQKQTKKRKIGKKVQAGQRKVQKVQALMDV